MATGQKNKFRIMIADDDLDDHYMIKQAIEDISPDASCLSVYNGLELMETLNNNKESADLLPNLIIMDLNMPLLNGFGALSQLKANEALRHIPVYILSTSRFDYDKEKAQSLGADDFYTKPYKYHDLKEIIKDIYTRTAATEPNK